MNRAGAPRGYRVLAALVLTLARLFRLRLDVAGVEHVPASGGAVLTWNHIGHLDIVATAIPVWRERGRWLRALAMRELWHHRTLGWVPRLAQCVPVDRTSDDGRLDAYRDAVRALRAGDVVVVAPEGTISTSFELQPFRTGAVRMAQAAGVPVVPSASWGSHRVVTTGHPTSLRRAWRLPVTVRFGEPLLVAPEDDPVAATEELRRRTQALLDDARAAYPDGAPPGAWWVPAALGGSAPPPDVPDDGRLPRMR